jgi:hypothetical protein
LTFQKVCVKIYKRKEILNFYKLEENLEMPEIKYEVIDKIGIVNEGNNGWNKELNLISWNDKEPVYDIRTWSPGHEKMGKGVTISAAEAKVLRDLLNSLNLD